MTAGSTPVVESLSIPAALVAEIESRFGRAWTVLPLGTGRRTLAVRAGGAIRAIVKILQLDRRPEDVSRTLEMIRQHGVACPALLTSVRTSVGWVALFEHVEGHRPVLGSAEWAETWSAAFALMLRLAAIHERVAAWDLESEWLALVAPAAGEDEAAADVLHRLHERPPAGPLCLAHGDFAPQNFVLTAEGLTLIDWEHLGYARPGFDAGWLLGLNRVGTGPRWPQDRLAQRFAEMGLTRWNLKWFEGMGLLRMHARAHGWQDRPWERTFGLEMVRAAIRGWIETSDPR
jgi:hypothetical protein